MVKKSKDALDAVIERSGDVSRFTVRDIMQDLEKLAKAKNEMKVNADLQQRIVDKVVEQNPEVLGLKEKVQKACYLFIECSEKQKAFNEKSKAITKMIKEYKGDLEEIQKQTGVSL